MTITEPGTLPLLGRPYDVVVAGNGHVLLLPMNEIGKIAVLDGATLEIRYVNIEAPEFLVAGGSTRFVVVDVQKQTLTRWNLATLKPEQTAPLVAEPDRLIRATMGSDSEGPLALMYSKVADVAETYQLPLRLYDLNSLERRELRQEVNNLMISSDFSYEKLQATADGKAFFLSSNFKAVPSATSDALIVNSIRSDIAAYFSDDGKLCYESRKIHDLENNLLFDSAASPATRNMLVFPAHGSKFWFSYRDGPRIPGKRESVDFFFFYGLDARPITNVNREMNFIARTTNGQRWSWPIDSTAKKLTLLPQVKRLFFVEDFHMKKIYVIDVDLEVALQKSPQGYLFLEDPVLPEYTAGQPYRHQLKAQGKAGPIQFKLTTGPDGLTVSPTGLIEWSPSKASGDHHLFISLTDSLGQNIVQDVPLRTARVRRRPDLQFVDNPAGGAPIRLPRTNDAPLPPARPPFPARPSRSQSGMVAGASPKSASPPAATPSSTKPDTDPVPFSANAIGDFDAVIPLVGGMDEVIFGGHGRYLVAPMQDLQKAAVVDVREGKLLKYVNLDFHSVKVVAGRSHLIVVDAYNKRLTSWRFDNLEKPVAEVRIRESIEMSSAAIGINSDGPLAVSYSLRHGYHEPAPPPVIEFFDPETLKPTATLRGTDLKLTSDAHLRAFADGQTFMFSGGGQEPRSLVRVRGDAAVVDRLLTFPKGYANPAKDMAWNGRYIFSSGSLHPLDGETPPRSIERSGFLGHSHPSDYWSHITSQGTDAEHQYGVAFYREEEPGKLTSLSFKWSKAEGSPGAAPERDGRFGPAESVLYVGTEKTIVLIPPNQRQVCLKRFDLDAVVKNLPRPILFLRSTRWMQFERERPFTQQLEAVSNREPATFRLEGGPVGMTVSPSGELKWTPGTDVTDKQTAIVNITAAGKSQSVTLTFTALATPYPAVKSLTAVTTSPVSKPVVAAPPPRRSNSRVTSPAPPPADFVRPTITIPLPAPIHDVVIGAGGRYLIATLPKLRRVAVVDMQQRRLMKLIKFENEDLRIAAGADKFFVADNKDLSLTRFDLATGARELSVTHGFTKIRGLGLGCRSTGPLLLAGHQATSEMKYVPLDLKTLQPTGPELRSHFSQTYRREWLLASDAAGRFFFGFGRFLDEKKFEEIQHPQRRGIPSADGRFIYSAGAVYAVGEVVPYDRPTAEYGIYSPSPTDPLYLSWPEKDGPVVLHPQGDAQTAVPLVDVNVPRLINYRDGDTAPEHMIAQHAFFLTAHDAIVTIPIERDRLVVQQFKLDDELARAQQDYLLVTSTPPAFAAAGSPLRYQLAVKSKRGQVKYRLSDAAPGLKISPDGLLEGTMSTAGTSAPLKATVLVSDASGREVTHPIQIQVGPSSPPSAAPAIAAAMEPLDYLPPRSTPIPPREKTVLDFPQGYDDFCPAGGGRMLLVWSKQAGTVSVVDLVAKRIVKAIPVDDDDVHLAGGATKFVIYGGLKKTLTRYDLATQALEQVELFPATTVVSIGMGCNSEGPVLVAVEGPTVPESLDSSVVITPERRVEALSLSSLKLESPAMAVSAKHNHGQINVTPDGRSFSCGYIFGFVRSGKIEVVYADTAAGAAPTGDGRIWFLGREGRTRRQEIVYPDNSRLRYIPALVGPHMLVLDVDNDGKVLKGRLGSQWETVTSTNVYDLTVGHVLDRSLQPDRRRNQITLFVPEHELFACTGPREYEFVIQRLSLPGEMSQGGHDYFTVTTSPPEEYVPGQDWYHQVRAISQRGTVRFRLEEAPSGMAITTDGTLTWRPDATENREHAILLAAVDSVGRQIFQSFSIRSGNVPYVGDPKVILYGKPVNLSPPEPAAPVTPTVAATSAPVAVSTSAPAVAAGPREKQTLKLPAGISNLCVGGAGRYVVAHLKSLRQVVVVDVKARKILKYLPVQGDRVLLAAGMRKFVVAAVDKNSLERYDLATGVREKQMTHELAGVLYAAMGSASEGPLLIGGGPDFRGGFEFLDLNSLARVPVNVAKKSAIPPVLNDNARAAANGSLFTLWRDEPPRFGMNVLSLVGTNVDVYAAHDDSGLILPAADGSSIFSRRGVYQSHAQLVTPGAFDGDHPALMLPAAVGPLSVLYRDSHLDDARSSQSHIQQLTLHVASQIKPILALRDVVYPTFAEDEMFNRPALTVDKRLLFLPGGDAIATVPLSMDQLIVQRFNLDEELAQSTVDYFFTSSIPPTSAEPGKPIRYQIEARSKQGGARFRLESGPTGMTVSPAGLVEWQPTAGQGEQTVIVVVSDNSGQEIFHNFTLRTSSAGMSGPVAVPPASPSSTTLRPQEKLPKSQPTGTAPLAKLTAAEFRTWSSSDGNYTVRAKFIQSVDGKASLQREDGQVITVPLDRLSPSDRKYVSQMTHLDKK